MITLPRRHEIQDMKSAILKVSDYLGNDVVFSPKDLGHPLVRHFDNGSSWIAYTCSRVYI